MQVTIDWENTTSAMGVHAVASYTDVSISADTVENMAEGKYAKLITLGNASAGTSVKRMVLPWMTISRIMGQKGIEPDNNMYAATTTSPADLAYCILRCQAADAVSTIVVIARTTILIRVVFKDLIPTYPSLKNGKIGEVSSTQTHQDRVAKPIDLSTVAMGTINRPVQGQCGTPVRVPDTINARASSERASSVERTRSDLTPSTISSQSGILQPIPDGAPRPEDAGPRARAIVGQQYLCNPSSGHPDGQCYTCARAP